MTPRFGTVFLFLLALSRSLANRDYLPEVNSVETDNEEEQIYENKKFVPKLLSYVFSMLHVDEVAHDLKYGTISASTCNTCKFGIGMLQHYVQSGKTPEEIAKTAVSICKSLGTFTDRVCEGAINLFKDEVLYVFTRVALNSDQVCGSLLGRNCSTVVNPLHDWTVPTTSDPKPPVKPIKPPKTGKPVLRVLQLSDIHFDSHYTEGSNAACKEPLCCRLDDGPAPTPEDAAGKWGDYRNCDTPERTMVNMLEHISKEHKDIDYIMWTGDIPPHDVWNSSKVEYLNLIRVSTEFVKYYFPSIPVFPSIGNHESVPVNSFPPPEVTGKYDISWLYNHLASYWRGWLTEDSLVTFRKGGYYSIKVYPGLRIIGVNSNYCNSLNWWLLLNSTDPAQELEWLVQELQHSEDIDEKVHIVGHIPPGAFDCLQVWSRNFYSIINRYESTVTGQFYGHTHNDEFEVFYDVETLKRPTNVAYIGPSVTTFGGVNPSYRIYTVDGNYPGSTYAILDHETYFMNLTEANLFDKPIWRKAYSAKEEYRMSAMNPSDWDELVKRFETDDELFNKFYSFHSMKSDYIKAACTESCKDKMICQLRSGRSNDPVFCKAGSEE